MANLTLFVPDNLKERMQAHKEIRWSKAVREIIETKLDDLEVAEKLAQKSRLTEQDVEELASKARKAAGRHAEALLRESRG